MGLVSRLLLLGRRFYQPRPRHHKCFGARAQSHTMITPGGQRSVMEERHMATMVTAALEAAFPGEQARYFQPMSIGTTPADADRGVALILDGTKTATSSPFWHYPDGRIPFVSALSVLLDGSGIPRAIVETHRIEIIRFGSVNAEQARDYGEGPRTLEWWIRVMGAYYAASAARHGVAFSDDTDIIFEWFRPVHRL
jgi:uncharacterized protein YhfF